MTAGSKEHPSISEAFPRARLFLLKEHIDHLRITILGKEGGQPQNSLWNPNWDANTRSRRQMRWKELPKTSTNLHKLEKLGRET